MKGSMKVWIGIVVVVAFFVYGLSGGSEGKYDTFAKCLTENGLKMYGTEWCSHCKDQKSRFGDSFEFIDYTDCDRDKDICTSEGITGYPTWKIDGNAYSGTQQIIGLAGLAGCELVEDAS